MSFEVAVLTHPLAPSLIAIREGESPSIDGQGVSQILPRDSRKFD